eukprot:CAMPEP_0196579860 /NCGR_PEP_ID=MMETSP1081-20130531/25293_1 /TAXON_ID=36882 /ORGANISM="Pyramimonas amylifera, Strain CCMP720" /LENGTH=181 /DNA_ID=CAMNT_0041899565 /DNA_START=132 /DNA_END=677 /DNA_ORIENTATION=+
MNSGKEGLASQPSSRKTVIRNKLSASSTTGRCLGVVIVDHGSRLDAANDRLLDFVELYREQTGRDIVEPAHMELASPSIDDAFAACVAQGADTVVISPYFLSPGRHWKQDIPRLAQEAADKHVGVNFLVSAPIGVHKLVAQVLDNRIEYCLQQAEGNREACSMCKGTSHCKMNAGVKASTK